MRLRSSFLLLVFAILTAKIWRVSTDVCLTTFILESRSAPGQEGEWNKSSDLKLYTAVPSVADSIH